jgi:hypothetical protein
VCGAFALAQLAAVSPLRSVLHLGKTRGAAGNKARTAAGTFTPAASDQGLANLRGQALV